MRNKLKKGFTLVELVVVLILMGLITTAIAMVLRPTTSLYIDVNNKTNEEIAAITLFDVLNGELRYATDINIVSATDDTVMPSSTLRHFILLSNGKRDGNHLNAHGYIKHGYTSNGVAGARYVGSSDSLLENTDIKFSIDGYSAEAGRESITVGAVMHPMNTKGIMKNKEYKYSETFKLLNMQNRAQLTKTTIGTVSAVNYDSDAILEGIKELYDNNNELTGTPSGEQAIFIFYQRPDEAPSTVSPSSLSTSTNFQPFTATRGNKEIDLGAVLKEAVIHVDSGVTGNVELAGGVTTTWNGNPKHGGENFPVSIQDYSVKFSGNTANDYILFHLTDGTTFKVTGADLAASPASIEKYLYDDGSGSIVHDTEYQAPDALPEPATQVIHFVKYPGADGMGITVQNTSGKNKAVSAGDEKLNANAATTTTGGNFDVYVKYYLEGSSATIKLARDQWNTIMDIGTFTETDCPEIWIAGNGNIYYSEADCLADVPVPSMSVDASAISVSGSPGQYSGSLNYSIPVVNTGSADITDFTVIIHVDGPYNLYYGSASVSLGSSSVEYASGDVKISVRNGLLMAGQTLTLNVSLSGATGQATNNISDYVPTSASYTID